MTDAIGERLVLMVLIVAGLSGCSQAEVSCGGDVRPKGASSEALKLVSKARSDSTAFCSEHGMGCDFSVGRTREGWSVAVTRTFAVDGKCVSRIGDEKFFVYDAQGALLQVIEGM